MPVLGNLKITYFSDTDFMHARSHMTRRQVLRYKSVMLKYVGQENKGYVKFLVFA